MKNLQNNSFIIKYISYLVFYLLLLSTSVYLSIFIEENIRDFGSVFRIIEINLSVTNS